MDDDKYVQDVLDAVARELGPLQSVQGDFRKFGAPVIAELRAEGKDTNYIIGYMVGCVFAVGITGLIKDVMNHA